MRKEKDRTHLSSSPDSACAGQLGAQQALPCDHLSTGSPWTIFSYAVHFPCPHTSQYNTQSHANISRYLQWQSCVLVMPQELSSISCRCPKPSSCLCSILSQLALDIWTRSSRCSEHHTLSKHEVQSST